MNNKTNNYSVGTNMTAIRNRRLSDASAASASDASASAYYKNNNDSGKNDKTREKSAFDNNNNYNHSNPCLEQKALLLSKLESDRENKRIKMEFLLEQQASLQNQMQDLERQIEDLNESIESMHQEISVMSERGMKVTTEPEAEAVAVAAIETSTPADGNITKSNRGRPKLKKQSLARHTNPTSKIAEATPTAASPLNEEVLTDPVADVAPPPRLPSQQQQLTMNPDEHLSPISPTRAQRLEKDEDESVNVDNKELKNRKPNVDMRKHFAKNNMRDQLQITNIAAPPKQSNTANSNNGKKMLFLSTKGNVDDGKSTEEWTADTQKSGPEDSGTVTTPAHDRYSGERCGWQDSSFTRETTTTTAQLSEQVKKTPKGLISKAQPRPDIIVPPRGIGPVTEPNVNDVLCGRGGIVNSHEGNIRFRNIIQKHKPKYLSDSTRKLEKAHIAAEIVRLIRGKDPSGRFLKRDERSAEWWDVGDARALIKVGQALREAAPELRKQLEQIESGNEGSSACTPPKSCVSKHDEKKSDEEENKESIQIGTNKERMESDVASARMTTFNHATVWKETSNASYNFIAQKDNGDNNIRTATTGFVGALPGVIFGNANYHFQQQQQHQRLRLMHQQGLFLHQKQQQHKSIFPWTPIIHRVLQDVFGIYSGFRDHQESIINSTMSGNDVFVIMRTGGGKSLTYQVPALLEGRGLISPTNRKVTFVISPFLPNIHDQEKKMNEFAPGSAMSFTSDMTGGNTEHARQWDMIRDPTGNVCLVFFTPEELYKSRKFIAELQKLYEQNRLGRFVIDECHCACEWGHDFRPDYTKLGIFKTHFPLVPVIAVTATASDRVKQDVCQILRLSPTNTHFYRSTANRSNLTYSVRCKADKPNDANIDDMANFIKENHPHGAGIIYTYSTKDADMVADKLCDRGIIAQSYHSDANATLKEQTHQSWMRNETQVVVATIAFCLCINKPDVRFVLHHTISKTLEGYYQESGRAGRDGKPADCILYYSPKDVERMIKMVHNSGGAAAALTEQSFWGMVRYAQAHGNDAVCRAIILNVLGEPNCRIPSQVILDNDGVTTERRDVGKHCKIAVSLLNSKLKEGEATTISMLVSTWRSKAKNSPECVAENPPVADLSVDDCERIIVSLLIEEILDVNVVGKANDAVVYLKLGRLGPQLLASPDPRYILAFPKKDPGSKKRKSISIPFPETETMERRTLQSAPGDDEIMCTNKNASDNKRLSSSPNMTKYKKKNDKTFLTKRNISSTDSGNTVKKLKRAHGMNESGKTEQKSKRAQGMKELSSSSPAPSSDDDENDEQAVVLSSRNSSNDNKRRRPQRSS